MAATFAQLVDSPTTFEFKGKIYKLVNLTLKEWGEVCEFVVFQKYHLAKKYDLSEKEVREIFDECVKNNRADIRSAEVITYVSSVPGFFRIFEISLRRGNPNITSEELAALLSEENDEEVFLAAAVKLYPLIGFFVPDTEKEPEKNEQPPSLNQMDL